MEITARLPIMPKTATPGLLGDRLKRLRESKGYTQEEFAALMGVAYQQVWRWESGKNDPSGDTLVKMATILGVTTDYLLGLSDDVSSANISESDLSNKELELVHAYRTGRIWDLLRLLGEVAPGANEVKN